MRQRPCEGNELVDTKAFLALLRTYVESCGTQAAAAHRLGVSMAYLSDVLLHKRTVGQKIPRALGYVPLTIYQRREDGI